MFFFFAPLEFYGNSYGKSLDIGSSIYRVKTTSLKRYLSSWVYHIGNGIQTQHTCISLEHIPVHQFNQMNKQTSPKPAFTLTSQSTTQKTHLYTPITTTTTSPHHLTNLLLPSLLIPPNIPLMPPHHILIMPPHLLRLILRPNLRRLIRNIILLTLHRRTPLPARRLASARFAPVLLLLMGWFGGFGWFCS